MAMDGFNCASTFYDGGVLSLKMCGSLLLRKQRLRHPLVNIRLICIVLSLSGEIRILQSLRRFLSFFLRKINHVLMILSTRLFF
jgi:hypothetical protein